MLEEKQAAQILRELADAIENGTGYQSEFTFNSPHESGFINSISFTVKLYEPLPMFPRGKRLVNMSMDGARVELVAID